MSHHLHEEVDSVSEAEADKIVELVHEIFEGDKPYPVVVHTFKGKTREEAEGYFKAHMKTDKFLFAMETEGKFGKIKGRTKKSWK